MVLPSPYLFPTSGLCVKFQKVYFVSYTSNHWTLIWHRFSGREGVWVSETLTRFGIKRLTQPVWPSGTYSISTRLYNERSRESRELVPDSIYPVHSSIILKKYTGHWHAFDIYTWAIFYRWELTILSRDRSHDFSHNLESTHLSEIRVSSTIHVTNRV